MKFVILKSTTLLCYQFAEQNGTPLQILCFDRKKDFENYLKENRPEGENLPIPRLINGDFPYGDEMSPKGDNTFRNAVNDGVFIHQKNRFVKIRFADILWVEASRNYSYLHLKDGSSVMLSYPLTDVKQKLPADIFMQIHRSFVVNLPLVDGLAGNMVMIGKQKLPVSKPNRRALLGKFTFMEAAKPIMEEEEKE